MLSLIKRFRSRYLAITNPLEYAARIGVNFVDKQSTRIYGRVNWGTEPWLITIGRGVHITDGCRFITHDGGTLLFRDQVPDLEVTKPIVIGDRVYVGNNVIFLPGVTIGDLVVIGAGAVVSKDIQANSVAVGVPARAIKTADDYLEKLKKESLHLGHLRGADKDAALMEHFDYKGKSKGIYS